MGSDTDIKDRGEEEPTASDSMATAPSEETLTEIKELNKLIESNEQQLVISILEDKKHIREQKNFNAVINTAVIRKREKILIWLVRNVYDKNKNAALEMAVKSGIENVIYLALENGANVNVGLYFAVKFNQLHVIKLLLTEEADINYVRNGYTLLHTAILQNCKLYIVEFLIYKVKDIDAVANNKKTALDMVQDLLKKTNDQSMKEHLENIQDLILLTKQTKSIMFECLQGLPDNLRSYTYQIKLLTLYAIVYTKLAISENCEYELGTEATHQVPFDDIFIKETRKGRTNCQFVQVKQTRSPQYNRMKESKFFTLLKPEKEINMKELLKGNDTIVKMFIAFDKISDRYLQNGTSGELVYCTNTSFENNSCIFLATQTKDAMLCGVGGKKWQIAESCYLELEIKFILLNLIASSQYIKSIDVNNQLIINEQIKIINNFQIEKTFNLKVNNNLWPVFKIAKEGVNAIVEYFDKLEKLKKMFIKANDALSLKEVFPDEFELPQYTGNFEVYKSSCLAKINEIYKDSKNDKALYMYFSKWDDATLFTQTINNFIQHFSIYTDCPNTETLEDIITEEICQELAVHKATIFSNYCLQEISKWVIDFKNERGNLYTDREGKKMFSDLTEQIFKGFSKIYDDDLQRYNLSFRNYNSELLNFLINENIIFHVITEYTRLHIIKVLQTLKFFERQSSDFNYVKQVVVTNSEIVFNSDNTVKKVMKALSGKDGTNYFILELAKDVNECDRSLYFLNQLEAIISQKKIKVILIGKNDNYISLSLKYIYLSKRKYCRSNEVICFKDLTEESQEKVLQKTVTFRNSPESTLVDLKMQNCLTQSAACDFIDEMLLSWIITEANNIQLGNCSAYYSDEYNADYYISRTVHNQILDKSILTYIDKYLFFITGICAEKLISKFDIKYDFVHYWEEGKTFDVGIILLRDCNNKNYSNDHIFSLISDSCHRNTYWLDIRDNFIFWKGVKIYNISDHIHLKIPIVNETISLVPSVAPHEIDDKIVILANNAGDGKSTMLTNLAHILKNKFPRRWIVRVDLKNYVNKTLAFSLNNIAFTEEDTSKAVEFVAHMVEQEKSKINSILERKIFEAALNGSSQLDVVLLFDGFDEISPDYKIQTCTLLKALVKSKVRQLWVTTRMHLQEYLEGQLQAPACMLAPFSDKQVIEYLNRFWKWKLKNYKDESKLDTDENNIISALDHIKIGCWNCRVRGANELVNLLMIISSVGDFKSSSLLDFYKFIDEVIDLSPLARLASKTWSVIRGQNRFFNMPLNLELFAENIFADKWDSESFENFQLFEMYKRFIERKFDIYKNIKSTTHSGRPADKDQGDIASVVFRDMHREIAVKTLFKPSDALPDINVCKKHGDLYEKLSRVGLMKAYADRFEFYHRTYAEYFFVEYLALNLEMYNVQCEFLPKILIKKDFFMLRKLFNGFLSQRSLKSDHKLETNYSIKNILTPSVSKEIVSEFDEESNNVLHIAVSEGHIDIFMLIVNNITTEDFIHLNMKATSDGSSMLHLIIEDLHSYLLAVTMFLIEKYPDTLQQLLLMSNRVGTCLHEVAILNRWEECDIILKTIKKYETLLKATLTAKTSNGYTPVEYALIYNNTDIVNLFAKAAEENISDDIISDMLPNIYSSLDTTLDNAAEWSVSEIFTMLQKFKRGSSMFKPDSNKLSALHLAACKGDVVRCSIIMSNYLNKEQIINCPWKTGTPLHLAAEHGHSEVCELIIKFAKQNYNVFEDLMTKYDHDEQTVLQIAILNGHSLVCDVILKSVENDFDILNYLFLNEDRFGRNIIHLATRMDVSKICGIIIKAAQNHPSTLEALLISKDMQELTVLNLAAVMGNSHVCNIIIRSAEKYPNPDVLQYLLTECDITESTVLHEAVISGSLESCNLILEVAERNPDILNYLLNSCDTIGETPMHKAAYYKHNEVFDLIAAYAINNQNLFEVAISAKNDCINSVLHIAAIKGNVEMCQAILAFAKYNVELLRYVLTDYNQYGETALHFAAKTGHSEVCRVITNSVRMYPDILSDVLFKLDVNKRTALHLAAGNVDDIYNTTEKAMPLCQNDVVFIFPPNEKSKKSNEPFKRPTLREIIKLNTSQDLNSAISVVLLDATEDVELLQRLIMQRDTCLRTALHIAALSGNSKTCKIIMNSAQKLNVVNELITKRDKNKCTALHLAAQYGHLNVFEEIVKHVEGNRDMLWDLIIKCDKYKQNLLNVAIINERSDVCEAIIKCASQYAEIFTDVIIDKGNPLHLAAEYSNSQICRSIIQHIKSEDIFIELIHKIDDDSRTVLHVAGSRNEMEVYEVIFSLHEQYPYVIDELLKKCERNQQTVLHVASQNGHDKFCDAILLSTNNSRDVFEYLLMKCDKNKQTALHLAAKSGYVNVCARILQFAMTNSKIYKDLLLKRDINKHTALDLAVANRFRKLYCLLAHHHNYI